MFENVAIPRRPAIPLSLYALITMVTIERAMLRACTPWVTGLTGKAICACVGVLAMAIAVLLALQRKDFLPVICVVAATMVAALALSSKALEHHARCAELLERTAISYAEFVVVDTPTKQGNGFRARATAHILTSANSHADDSYSDGGDVWLVLPEYVPRGTVVRCVGRFSHLDDDEWGMASRMQGICGTVYAVRLLSVTPSGGVIGLLEALRTKIVESIDPMRSPARALVAGCVCGYRDGLKAFEIDESFSRCGIAHLVAVSGGHLCVLTMLLDATFDSLRVSKRVRVALTVGICGLFVLFCGAPVSAIRALLMSATALVGGLVGRRAHALSGLATMALCMAAVDPALSGQAGFVLSVLSVGSLCLFGPYSSYACSVLAPTPELPNRMPATLRRFVRRAWRCARSSVATSLVALVATTPLVAGTFGELSLVGPVANALLSAPFTAFVATGIVASALWWAPPLQTAALLACDVLGLGIVWLAEQCARLPLSSIMPTWDTAILWLFVGMGAALLLVWWPEVIPNRLYPALAGTCALVLALYVRLRFFAPARICVLDVGQGDSILVQDGASTLLVDAGVDESASKALARMHVVHVDAVLITHQHDDHYGGLEYLANTYRCDRIIMSQGAATHVVPELGEVIDRQGSHVDGIGHGDTLRVGGFSLRVVSPIGEPDGTENAHSVQLLATYGVDGYSTDDRASNEADGSREGESTLVALLTGDAERDELANVLARHEVGDIDVLKVGHHGSEVSLTPAQAAELDPEVSIASAGENNRYGHPSAACVKALEDAGSLFLCTKDVGDVEIRPGRDGPHVLYTHPSF